MLASVCLVALAATACSSSGGHNGSAPASPTTSVPAYRLDDALAQPLADRLAKDTGRSWRVVPLSEFR